MSRCNYCRQDGLVFLRYTEAEGYGVAACLCGRGKWWRQKWQLRAWADQQRVKPVEIGRLEEFFTAEELNVLKTTEGPAPC